MSSIIWVYSSISIEKTNQIADVLTKFGINQSFNFKIYDSTLNFLSLPILRDSTGVLVSSFFESLASLIHQN
jgi:hypothetical protein